MATPTNQQLIQMLSKAETQSEAGDDAASVAELLAAKFSWCSLTSEYRKSWSWFLETVRRIAGPIKHQGEIRSVHRCYSKCR